MAFTEERRAQIFKQIGDDKPVGLAQFKSIFDKKLSCIQTVTITDGLSIADRRRFASWRLVRLLRLQVLVTFASMRVPRCHAWRSKASQVVRLAGQQSVAVVVLSTSMPSCLSLLSLVAS